MKAKLRPLGWILPAVVFLFACTMTSAESTAAPAKTEKAETPEPEPTATQSNVIFEDDFSSSASGWGSLSDEYGTSSYTDGAYVITVEETLTYLFEDLDDPADLADVQVDVDIMASDEVLHDAGVLCRIQDSDNFYYFIIASDGYYAIGKFKDGEDILLGTEDMLKDTDGVIRQGAADNHLQAVCAGNQLTLVVNGIELFSVEDEDFASGAVGLIAGSYEDVPVTVIFDNFVLAKP
ncbi:MAG: hypothetical protein JW929_15735 [Anaerolineales bacterium]|nr:hypothetical protein [Anaerolineales bacterium]